MRTVDTPVGPAAVDTRRAVGTCLATLVLGHGAGGGVGTPDLLGLARGLPQHGITVVRVEQPWRVAGRRVASAPPVLDRAWLAVLAQLRVDGVLVVGGRSAGARVACRTAGEVGAAAVVALAFPLRPPGGRRPSRIDELEGAGVPTLVVQGERDTFGLPGDFPRRRGRTWTVHAVPHADHSFRVPKGYSGAAAVGEVVDAVRAWVLAHA